MAGLLGSISDIADNTALANNYSLSDFDPTNADGQLRQGLQTFDVTDPNSGIREGLSNLDPTKAAHVDSFVAPTLKAATPYDPLSGATGLQAQEKALGIQAFNPAAYTAKQEAGLRANIDEGVRAERSTIGNRMGRSGFLNSGTAEALDRESIGRGARSYAMGDAQIGADAAGKQLAENNNRLGLANSIGQFGATLGEQQRVTDNNNTYGQALDEYQLNELDPARNRDALRAGTYQLGAGLVGAGLSTVGTIAGQSAKAGGAIAGGA